MGDALRARAHALAVETDEWKSETVKESGRETLRAGEGVREIALAGAVTAQGAEGGILLDLELSWARD